VVYHLLCTQDSRDQHDSVDELANWRLLRRINDTSVVSTGSVESKKVGVLREHNPSLRQSIVEELFICRSPHVRFLYREDVYATSAGRPERQREFVRRGRA